MWQEYLRITAISLNVTALLFLLGLMYYTRAFRMRGTLRDRLFFLMLTANIIAALTDIFINYFQASPFHEPTALMMAVPTVFAFAIEIFAFLMLIYAVSFTEDGYDRIRHRWPVYSVPALCGIILAILNLPLRFLYTVEPAESYYITYRAYDILFLPFLICILCAAISLWRIHRAMSLMILSFVAMRFLMEFFIPDVSSSSLFMSVLLTYLHIGAMNRTFHDEEVRV